MTATKNNTNNRGANSAVGPRGKRLGGLGGFSGGAHKAGVVQVEVRPGEGGDDAAVFAKEIMDAIVAQARRQNWTVKAQRNPEARTVAAVVSGTGVAALEWMAGTHRCQRIPRNDSKGRRHTSTATVAVLHHNTGGSSASYGSDDVEVEVFCASGPGGQHRNRNATAVRLRHLPTGMVVVATRERSQAQNLRGAHIELKQRLEQRELKQAAAEENTVRKAQTRSERSARGFTWNEQRDEVVAHDHGVRVRTKEVRRGKFLERLAASKRKN